MKGQVRIGSKRRATFSADDKYANPCAPNAAAFGVPTKDLKVTMTDQDHNVSASDIAIVGMALRVPGAKTVSEFWRNLRDGVESIRTLTHEELLAAGESPSKLRDKNYVARAADLCGFKDFDADFFGFSPKEAAILDPQHRHFLECAWEALEDAARPPSSVNGSVAVFAGCGMGSYFYFNVCSHQDLINQVGMFLLRHTGNDKDFLSTRVSHLFDLQGPSINVQTACSTSLVAVHYACQSLLNGECEMALAGGVTIEIPHGRGYVYQDGEILSPDGHCRAFDHRAAGTVFGSGAGVVVLRRLSDAIADGDQIRAVIKATAVNNDGASKAGYLAPSVTGQAKAIVEAHALAGVSADTIQYVECHGTGTALGDPIEVEALNEAFRHSTTRKDFCRIGSVKSNIGHLDTAAGVVSLIKATLALQHREIPATLGYEKPNPAIRFNDSPFLVCDRLTPWPVTVGPRRAGVNSLGVGGTNAHAVLEEAPARPPAAIHLESDGSHLFVLSAKSKKALDAATLQLANFLDSNPNVALPRISSSLFHGRTHFDHRRVVAAGNRELAISALKASDTRNSPPTHSIVKDASGAVFLFPGGGAQYPGMASALYRGEPAFRETVDQGLSYLPPGVAAEVRALWLESATPKAAQRFLNPSLQLPAILIVEIAIARLWMSWGIQPTALIGHSMGENAAACIAGVLSFERAVQLVFLRGKLFTEIPPGGMLSVPLSGETLALRMPADLDLASVNAPDLCVVSGSDEALDRFQASLAEDQIEAVRVPIEIAAHSRMLLPILGRFEAFLRKTPLSAPKIPIISNLTGEWLTDAQACDPCYWTNHLRSTVFFAKGLSVLSQDTSRIYIEVGPGRAMASLVKAQGTIDPNQVFNSLPHADEANDDRLHFLGAIGRAWATGLPVPLGRLWSGVKGERVSLPPYPFQHQPYWIAPKAASESYTPGTLKHKEIDDWFSVPTWIRIPEISTPAASNASSAPERKRWLVYSDGSALASNTIKQLEGSVIVVTSGPALAKVEDGHWKLDPTLSNHHRELLDALEETGFQPSDVIYFCGTSRPKRKQRPALAREERHRELYTSFFIPTFIVRALGRLGSSIQFNIVTSGLAQIRDEPINPLRATVIGPVLVAPREMPHIETRCIDVLPSSFSKDTRQSLDGLLHELHTPPRNRLLALRDSVRYTQTLHKLNVPSSDLDGTWLRDGGVYIITGGLGGIGLELAVHFAQSRKVKLALLARSELPPEEEWEAILDAIPTDSVGAQRLQRIRAIRALGSQVAVCACDVADPDSIELALERIRTELGPVTGVIHAAGVMDDEPIESKSLSSMQRVLDAKVMGAIHLDSLIEEPLDFFVVFSSVASSLGLPGQVDYTAANAFLDAFAIDRASRATGRSVVISWNAWRDVGMAARASDERQQGRAPSSVVAHPALDGYSDDSATGRTFVTDFTIDRHWLLSEHKIRAGMALLSGTTFVELARASFSVGNGAGPIEITDLNFLSPFQVAAGATRRLVIQIAKQGGASEVTMRTAGSDMRSAPHVIGDIRKYEGPTPSAKNLSSIFARCTTPLSVLRGGTDNQHFVDFGLRWANIETIRSGEREALIELALDPKFVADLEHYQLHPALLDMATAGAQRLIPGFDAHSHFFVPFSYGRLRMFERMPERFYSHVRLRGRGDNRAAIFDITLMDTQGKPFCDISRFEMKQIDPKLFQVETGVSGSNRISVETALDKVLRDAISPPEGLVAFNRIMAQPRLVQCVASSMDIAAWSRSLNEEGIEASGNDSVVSFSRPDLESDYEAPETDTEKMLAGIWAELLGIRQIGVFDDFFQLGGHSLHAVRLFAALRKHYGVSLPLSTLFEAPSIRRLASLLDAQLPRQQQEAVSQGQIAEVAHVSEPLRQTSLVPIQPLGNGPAFYCAAGMGGNPLNLRALAMEIGLDQPFFGLQPQGLDGIAQLHRTVPEMATYYIAEIKRHQHSGPYYLGGYSGGGVIAFEMAKQLVAAGESIGALVLLDSIAPAMERRSATDRFAIHRARLREGGARYALYAIRGKLNDYGHVGLALMRKPLRRLFRYQYRLENIVDTWTEAFRAYNPTPYAGSAVLFRASTSIATGTSVDLGEFQGWDRLILGGVDVNVCPGDHASMCDYPHVRVLARRLRSLLHREISDNHFDQQANHRARVAAE